MIRAAKEQPYGIEVHECDGLFLKQMFIPRRGTYIPQHSHEFEHLSMLVRGAVHLWKDEVYDGERFAPKGILIKAGVKHLFMSLTDNTEIWCVHNTHGEKFVKVLEEHQLLPGGV